ncbi:hypothetical protein [Ligilactobacillus faecis]|uniref:hypothetical protein n=1 Tax=Ligilactobacillus faecis TaxID=762833 RepID=UPI002468EEC0|nr:hypothetical protein [Ligilactobacillus faecis]WGN89537.1 hypothetical protein QFX10_00055 [Ligilactobacillus faecis]
MQTNEKKQRMILSSLAIVSCIFTLSLLPNNNNLKIAKEQLAANEKALKQRENKRKASMNVDLDYMESAAQQRLKYVFELVYGGIQTKNDLEKNKAMIKKVLGSKLANRVFEDTHYGDKFFVKKNINTQVSFQASEKKDSEVLVTVTYQFESQKEYIKLFKLNYNLERQQVNSYMITSLRGGSSNEA